MGPVFLFISGLFNVDFTDQQLEFDFLHSFSGFCSFRLQFSHSRTLICRHINHGNILLDIQLRKFHHISKTFQKHWIFRKLVNGLDESEPNRITHYLLLCGNGKHHGSDVTLTLKRDDQLSRASREALKTSNHYLFSRIQLAHHSPDTL